MSPSRQDWVHSRLGEYFQIKHGFAFKSKFFAKEGKHIVLTPGNFNPDGGIKLKGEKEKYYTGNFPDEYLLRRGELLVVMTDLTQNAPILGSPAFIPQDGIFLHNQRLGKIIDLDESRMDRHFLYYLLNSYRVRAQIKASATGATVRHTAPNRIYDVEVGVPPLPTQRKIAAILSAYDDLIENNTRRIAILEEMAQILYREWFVHFRFPGHESVPMVDTEKLGLIPKAWDIAKLGDIAGINLASIRKGNAPEHINYINISSVSPGRIEKIEPMAFEDAPGRARRIVRHGDIIWSTVRPNRRSYCLILDPVPNMIVSTGFAVITAQTVPYTYLYHALTTDEFVGYLVNHATGAAYPAVNTGDFENADILLPPSDLLELYHSTALNLFNEKQNLHKKNDVLHQTRDLLLPCLVSGQLDVANLDINMGGLA